MRRLLLLLLTFLLPLQLLAATVVDLAQHATPVEQGAAAAPAHSRQACALPVQESPAAALTGKVMQQAQLAQSIQSMQSVEPGVVLAAIAGDEGDRDDEGDEPDVPAPQADLEDHGIPASIATPDIAWHPFPHVFTAPLNGVSFLRDQLRPPPLI